MAMMPRIRFERNGAGRPGTFGTIAAPIQTNRKKFRVAEQGCRDPPCRRLRRGPATPIQIGRRHRWQAGYLIGPSTRWSLLNGRRGMPTEASAGVGRTCPDIPAAALPPAAPVTWTRPTGWRLVGTTARLPGPCPRDFFGSGVMYAALKTGWEHKNVWLPNRRRKEKSWSRKTKVVTTSVN